VLVKFKGSVLSHIGGGSVGLAGEGGGGADLKAIKGTSGWIVLKNVVVLVIGDVVEGDEPAGTIPFFSLK
jgi:hypothetical protein